MHSHNNKLSLFHTNHIPLQLYATVKEFHMIEYLYMNQGIHHFHSSSSSSSQSLLPCSRSNSSPLVVSSSTYSEGLHSPALKLSIAAESANLILPTGELTVIPFGIGAPHFKYACNVSFNFFPLSPFTSAAFLSIFIAATLSAISEAFFLLISAAAMPLSALSC